MTISIPDWTDYNPYLWTNSLFSDNKSKTSIFVNTAAVSYYVCRIKVGYWDVWCHVACTKSFSSNYRDWKVSEEKKVREGFGYVFRPSFCKSSEVGKKAIQASRQRIFLKCKSSWYAKPGKEASGRKKPAQNKRHFGGFTRLSKQLTWRDGNVFPHSLIPKSPASPLMEAGLSLLWLFRGNSQTRGTTRRMWGKKGIRKEAQREC